MSNVYPIAPFSDHNRATPLSSTEMSSFSDALRRFRSLDSSATFNELCRTAIDAWPSRQRSAPATFSTVLARIDAGEPDRAGLLPIKTGWGGVSIVVHEPPHIEKYLAVRRGSYLAFETHAQKSERLEVIEGAGLLLFRPPGETALRMTVLLPGDSVAFAPGEEHCVIGTDNLLLFERSEDPKGMDQDLIFIYEPTNG